MNQIGVEEEEKLGALVDLLERGEEVVITRNGREIARAVPAARAKVNPAEARRAPTNTQACRRGKARPFRLAGMEGVSGRRPAVSLVLDTSVTLAWIFPPG